MSDRIDDVTTDVTAQLAAEMAVARERLAQGDAPGAIGLLQHIARTQPANLEALQLLGAAYCNNGKVEEGIAVFERLVELYPTGVQAHFNLGAAYRQAQRLVQAHRQLDVALRLDPKYPRALRAREEWARDFNPDGAPITPAPTSRIPEYPVGPLASAPVHLNLDDPDFSAPRFDDSRYVPTLQTHHAPERTLPGEEPRPDLSDPISQPEALTNALPQGLIQFDSHLDPLTPPLTAMPAEVDEVTPSLWQLCVESFTGPGEMFDLAFPVYAAAPERPLQLLVFFLFGALIWSTAVVFEPGAGATAPTGERLLMVLVGIATAVIGICAQAGTAAAAAGAVGSGPPRIRFHPLLLRYGFAWALVQILLMGVGILYTLFPAHVLGLPIFTCLAIFATLVLNIIATGSLLRCGTLIAALVTVPALLIGSLVTLIFTEGIKHIH